MQTLDFLAHVEQPEQNKPKSQAGRRPEAYWPMTDSGLPKIHRNLGVLPYPRTNTGN
jgi:hypothetical protein